MTKLNIGLVAREMFYLINLCKKKKGERKMWESELGKITCTVSHLRFEMQYALVT